MSFSELKYDEREDVSRYCVQYDDIISPSEQANYLAQNYIQKTSLSKF